MLSVRANPACPDEAAAERAVNEVWESCFNDTRPFDEVSVTQGPERGGAGCLDERRIADVPPTDILELACSLLIFAHALATDRS